MSHINWKIGDKLVCIDSSGWTERLIEGQIYTISAIGIGVNSHLYVGLEETPNARSVDGLHWRARRFRPVQKRSTDISIFTDMLTHIPTVPA